MANKRVKTKTPSGLTIKRNGSKYTLSWKIADSDYGGGVQVRYRILYKYSSGWSQFTKLSAKATEYAVTVNYNSYSDFKGIEFELHAKRKDAQNKDKSWTYYDWAIAKKSYSVAVPNVPSLSAKLDDDLDNVTKFTWSTTVKDDDNKPFTRVEWQTRLAKESNVTDGSKLAWNSNQLGWSSGTGTRASSKTITEDTVILARNSYTRWFRVRAVGPRGASAWRYAKHVYAVPANPTINKAAREGVLNWVRVNWTAGNTAAHPIDLTTVEWAIGVPRANRIQPVDPSWNIARTVRDTGGKDEVLFLVDQALDLDELMWVRVGLQHDRNIIYDQNYKTGSAKLVTMNSMYTRLTPPTDLTVTTDTSTYRATIKATNNSAVPDSKLAIVLRRPNVKDIIVGVTSSGSGEKTITVQCPNWGTKGVSFGVYAFQGTATGKTSGGVTTYAITANMTSTSLWDGGSVPLAPTGVTASATATEGEVLLTWNWTWAKANRTELSWSQNPNAWESTDEPDTYIVTSLHVPKWRISGLKTGEVWYFRVRLAQETESEIVYGPYCSNIAVDLSSVPEQPVLTLSAGVVRAKNKFVASWVYTATDGTGQAGAEICEATVSGSTVKYGSVIAKATTKQSVTITAPSKWATNTVHYLCLRVKSNSGMVSAWSDPVSIAIANPLTCKIQNVSVVTGYDTLSGNIVNFETQDNDVIDNVTLDVSTSGSGTIEEPVAVASIREPVVYVSSTRSVTETSFEYAAPWFDDIDIYEATVDFATGLITVTKDIYNITGEESGYTDETGGVAFELPEEYAVTTTDNQVCSHFQGVTTENGICHIPTTMTAAELQDYFQDNHVRMTVSLAEPEVFQDSPVRPSNLIGHNYIWSDSGSVEVRIKLDAPVLTAMPLTATVKGAGAGGTTTLVIERADEYHMIRPDETELDGYEGETIALHRQDGESQISITNDGLIGRLDDGARYRIIATTQDTYGQTASKEQEFIVQWAHQAEIPTGTAVIDGRIAKITAVAPESVAEGDVCDIYRLSVDTPELIIQGGEFGTTYVDPYPTIGENGGHRIVHRTVNGDYITEDNQPAWIDITAEDGDMLDVDFAIIDFAGGQIEIPYNVVLDNSWEKDFKQTTYLGGSIQGDWNPGVSRKGSVSASIVTEDIELVQSLRRLAVYTGICHVRTQDGSSYAADVQVSDGVSYDKAGKILEFSLDITRVDPEGFDGMTLDDWETLAEE